MFKLSIALSIVLTCSLAHAGSIPDDTGVSCIIGEASDQGYDGLLAVADALQNRGSIKGVYGCTANHTSHEPEYVWKMARRAWQEAKTANPTHGAKFWENTTAFGVPYWAKKMKITNKIGVHTFYKKG